MMPARQWAGCCARNAFRRRRIFGDRDGMVIMRRCLTAPLLCVEMPAPGYALIGAGISTATP